MTSTASYREVCGEDVGATGQTWPACSAQSPNAKAAPDWWAPFADSQETVRLVLFGDGLADERWTGQWPLTNETNWVGRLTVCTSTTPTGPTGDIGPSAWFAQEHLEALPSTLQRAGAHFVHDQSPGGSLPEGDALVWGLAMLGAKPGTALHPALSGPRDATRGPVGPSLATTHANVTHFYLLALSSIGRLAREDEPMGFCLARHLHVGLAQPGVWHTCSTTVEASRMLEHLQTFAEKLHELQLDRLERMVTDAVENTDNVGDLPEGAPRPSSAAISAAIAAARYLGHTGSHRDVGIPVHVDLSAEGGVVLWYRHSASYVLVECDNDGDVTLFYNDRDRGVGHVLAGYEDATLATIAETMLQLLQG